MYFRSAAHLFLMDGERVLMLRRYNTGYEDGMYSLVAGHLEGNETVKQAMMREAREEVGIELDDKELEVIGVMHRKSDEERIDWFLSAHRWKGEVKNLEPHKCDDLRWVSINNMPENTIAYIKQARFNFQQKIWFDTFGL
ncbi:MAG: NUDIX domain-containing protein [Candidatus Heimdallarchaeota archaeon]|nr:NUDIX domain-containing protein [Candidatus Heimdallarchaeota archaeon]